MSSVKPAESHTKVQFAKLFAPIAHEIELVNRRLQTELQNHIPIIDQLSQHAFRMGGKRLRPALLLLAAQTFGEINDDHRTLAAVVEMIHTATLVHDDVLDEAELRRHEATMNARWDNHTSILLGDFLFSHAFYLSSTLETTFASRTIGQSTNIVCAGELRQTTASGNFELGLDEYFEIIEAKTAELTACCCKLGAHYSGADADATKALESYGRHLGIAFQIADDLLDLEGEEHLTGKSLGTDLEHIKMTLPLILLRDQLEGADRQEVATLVSTPKVENQHKLVEWLKTSGCLESAKEYADKHAQLAADAISSLPDNHAKHALIAIAEAVVSRDC